jgi:hypothetical protein
MLQAFCIPLAVCQRTNPRTLFISKLLTIQMLGSAKRYELCCVFRNSAPWCVRTDA